MAYSCDIFITEFPDQSEGFPLDPEHGAYLMAISNLIGSVASIFLIYQLGRRTILLLGQGSIALCLILMAYASYNEQPMMLLVLMCFLSFMF